MQPLQPGDPEVIGRYRLHGRLGEGGMGRVYAGRTPEGQQAAIKVIRDDLAGDTGFRQRFRREVAAAVAVAGMFTARVLDADPDADPPWLATQYVEGPSLRDLIMQRGPLDEPSLLRLAQGLAEALSAIHAAGLVHRDLKPANVLLAADGAKVIDFGIASLAGSVQLTGTGEMIGTPEYMSPEQVDGRGAPGPASDVFAMGATLCFAGTGRGPFAGAPGTSVLYRILEGRPDLRDLPRPVAELAAACLQKDPARRPTAPQLASWLRSGSAPTGVIGTPATPAPPARRPRRLLAGAALGVAALLLGGGAAVGIAAATGALGGAATPTPTPSPAPEPTPGPVVYDPASLEARYVDRLCKTGDLLVTLGDTATAPQSTGDPAVARTEFLANMDRTIGVVDLALPEYAVLRDTAPTPEHRMGFTQVIEQFETARGKFVDARSTVEASDPLTVDAYRQGIDTFTDGAGDLSFSESIITSLPPLPRAYSDQANVSPACEP